MTPDKYRIKSSLGFLNGWNGGADWEWTQNPVNCWYMSLTEAESRLLVVKRDVPDAEIERKRGRS